MSKTVGAPRTYGLLPERLVIDVTGSVAPLDVTQTLAVIGDLNLLGLEIALDDFGTGLSTISYLVLLNPKISKIDQAFVCPPREGTHNDSLLESVISLGKRLEMTLLAEGIETHGQLERFRGPGCESG